MGSKQDDLEEEIKNSQNIFLFFDQLMVIFYSNENLS